MPAVLVATLLAANAAFACDFHDGASLHRGVMNWAYPDSLHVRSAVWRAQSDGILTRDPLADRELTREAHAVLGLTRARKLMTQFGLALQLAPARSAREPISVVLLGPLLWSRFEPHNFDVRTNFHVDGPGPRDAVIVTELATVEALLERKLTYRDAIRLGVLKVYGPADAAASAQRWLASLTAG